MKTSSSRKERLTSKEIFHQFIADREIMLEKFNEITENIKGLESRVDPILTLKNGSLHQKRMSQAVTESWENINELKQKIDNLDQRTLVLSDIENMINHWKEFRRRASKYLYPLFKILAILLLLILVAKFIAEDRIKIYELLRYIIKATIGI